MEMWWKVWILGWFLRDLNTPLLVCTGEGSPAPASRVSSSSGGCRRRPSSLMHMHRSISFYTGLVSGPESRARQSMVNGWGGPKSLRVRPLYRHSARFRLFLKPNLEFFLVWCFWMHDIDHCCWPEFWPNFPHPIRGAPCWRYTIIGQQKMNGKLTLRTSNTWDLGPCLVRASILLF